MIAIDTNVLVYAHRPATPEHNAARKAIGRARVHRRGWGISLPTLAEFWGIVTYSGRAGRPSTVTEATAFIRSLVVDGGAQIWLPGPGFAERLMQIGVDLEIIGSRIFDLQIALTAFDNGATEIWTHDRNFLSIPGLRVQDPLI